VIKERVPSSKDLVSVSMSKEPGLRSNAIQVAANSSNIAGHPINGAIEMTKFPMRGIFGEVYSICPNVSPDGKTLNFVICAPISKRLMRDWFHERSFRQHKKNVQSYRY